MATVRDTTFGTFVRVLSGKRLLKFPEEQPGFKIPDTWQAILDDRPVTGPHIRSGEEEPRDGVDSASTSDEEATPENASPNPGSPGAAEGSAIGKIATQKDHHDGARADGDPYGKETERPLNLQRSKSREETKPYTADRLRAEDEAGLERTKSIPIVPKKTRDGVILVDWYYSDDPENPQNWSRLRRIAVTAVLCLYTFVVYMSSAIYTNSEQGVMEEFNVSELEATLGLALFVFGYGLGPLLWSPLSEIPRIGRNPVYVATVFVFVILSIPTALVHNFAGLLILRFLQGFFGSPCLASGGASIGDMFGFMSMPYGLVAWVSAAYCGPALGPLLSGFSVPVEGWRWSLLEIIWASVPAFLVMFFFLPETAAPNILLRRAQRLRKLTGNNMFQAQSEIDQKNMKPSEVAIDALIKPMEITIKDPAILFVQVYTAITYGIYYSFFEVFPLVYNGYYHMSPGSIGLVFLCVLVSCILGIAVYVSYIHWYMNPRIRAKGWPKQETRLVPAMFATFGPTIGLFLFAWTANPSIHWIVPTLGITIYGGTIFVVMQCIFVYVPLSYPQYAASLFAGNDFFRSSLAFASILFSQPLYGNLGVSRGTSLLGGLSSIGIIGIWVLYYYGATLRSKSKFAVADSVADEIDNGEGEKKAEKNEN